METIRNSEEKNTRTHAQSFSYYYLTKVKMRYTLFEHNKNIYHEDGKNSWDVLNTMPIVHICEAPAQ